MNPFDFLTDEDISKKFGTPLNLIMDGKSPQAKRFIVMGYLQEKLSIIASDLAPKVGRPALPDVYQSIDCIRAFCCWDMAHVIGAVVAKQNGEQGYSRQNGISIANRELIHLVDLVENKPDLAESTLETSVSRGKKILEIDGRWRSRVCDKLLGSLSQTT